MSNKDLLIFAEKLNNVQTFVESIIPAVLKIHSEDMLSSQKERIHIKGEDVFNKKFGDYSPFTVEEKKKKGQFTDYIILKDTEEFENSEFAKVNNNIIEFGATDSKTAELERDYGDILGLDENEEERYLRIIGLSILFRFKKYFA